MLRAPPSLPITPSCSRLHVFRAFYAVANHRQYLDCRLHDQEFRQDPRFTMFVPSKHKYPIIISFFSSTRTAGKPGIVCSRRAHNYLSPISILLRIIELHGLPQVSTPDLPLPCPLNLNGSEIYVLFSLLDTTSSIPMKQTKK